MSALMNSILQGNCVEEMQTLKKSGVRPRLIFADPPFNIGYDYDEYHDERPDSEYLEWSREWINAASELLAEDGSLWIAIGDEYVAELKMIADSCGLTMRNWIIWYYTFGVHCVAKFTRSHTHILYFVKDPKNFVFNDHPIRVPSARQLVYNDARADKLGRIPDNTWILRPQDVGADWEQVHDTWYVPRVAGTFKQRAGFHGCQMPERLLGRIVQTASDAGDLVLDPFSGSGTTVTVAKKLGRDYLGIELSPDYVKHSLARLDAIRPGDELEGPEDPLASAPATVKRSSKGQKLDQQHDDMVSQAFQKISQGYSADRILADPFLNAQYVDECSRAALPGRPVDWNRRLINLRKTGRLDVKTTKRTSIQLADLEAHLFASEMAFRLMLNAGYQGLDEVLCDPRGAIRFDEIARSLAPGFTSFEYRWGALWLRKHGFEWREAASELSDVGPLSDLPRKTSALSKVRSPIPKAAVYLLRGTYRKQNLIAYVGATTNFPDRLARIRQTADQLSTYLPISGEWQIEVIKATKASWQQARGMQSLLIREYQPRLNFLELG